jgi:hypothetical protein
MAQNTNSAAFAKETEDLHRELEEEMQRIAQMSEDEIIADLVASSKLRSPESEMWLDEIGSCKDQTMEQILWPEGAPSDHAEIDKEEGMLAYHKKNGFVLEKNLGCVLLGTYLGPYGPSERRCESGGVHECRHLTTNEFGGQMIVLKEPFYSVEHI